MRLQRAPALEAIVMGGRELGLVQLGIGLAGAQLNEPLLGGLLEPIEIGIRGQSLRHGNLLSLRPATAILGQERRRCQRSAGGGFNPLRGPSVACSTNRKNISGKSAKSSATLHESGCFIIPNPFDVGSARALANLGRPVKTGVAGPSSDDFTGH